MRNVTTPESLMLVHAKAGSIFYSHKPDKDLTALAGYYNREILTQKRIVLSGTMGVPLAEPIVKVTILK